MPGVVEMEDSSPVDAQHKEHVNELEGDGRNEREVDGQRLMA